MQTLTIIQPDDMHLHLRDGEALKAVLPFTARQMGRAVIMPNLKPPVASVADALAYRARIEAALPEGSTFEPLMTLYLTDNTTPDTVREAKAAGIVAFKLYPAGATTNSDSGVTDLFKLIPVLQTMAQEGILFLVHGEVTDPEIDIFDREAVFIERVMKPVLEKVPALKVVFEHITTADAARLVMEAGENVAASVTPHSMRKPGDAASGAQVDTGLAAWGERLCGLVGSSSTWPAGAAAGAALPWVPGESGEGGGEASDMAERLCVQAACRAGGRTPAGQSVGAASFCCLPWAANAPAARRCWT